MRTLYSLIVLAALAPVAHADEPTRARVLHVPPTVAAADQPLQLIAAIDGAWREDDLYARWRSRGDTTWHEAAFARSSAGGWYATIPADGVGKTGVEYYIAGRAGAAETLHFASPDAPHPVPVVADAIEQLAAQDEHRADGHTDVIDLDVDGHDFGNRHEAQGITDRFIRTEARWTHSFYRRLYAIDFGFGTIDGETPDVSNMDRAERARYGEGGVRFRLMPAVFVDARLALGVSTSGFIGGIGGTVTLGRPWGTCVQGGIDELQDMGPTAFIRLQWDTAAPLLMGASIVRTDLPGANLRGGVYGKYDVAYKIAGRVTARASVSYGARDGAAHWGGGLGMGYEF